MPSPRPATRTSLALRPRVSDHIQVSVRVDVAARDGVHVRRRIDGEGRSRRHGEPTFPDSAQEKEERPVVLRDRDVGTPVFVEVAEGEVSRSSDSLDGRARRARESALPVAEQDVHGSSAHDSVEESVAVHIGERQRAGIGVHRQRGPQLERSLEQRCGYGGVRIEGASTPKCGAGECRTDPPHQDYRRALHPQHLMHGTCGRATRAPRL